MHLLSLLLLEILPKAQCVKTQTVRTRLACWKQSDMNPAPAVLRCAELVFPPKS
jgi:hypothetical protein